MHTKRRGTLKQLGEYLRSRGFPISDSTLQKRTMPSRADGPPVDSWFGGIRMFDFDTGEAWAQGQLRATKRPSIIAKSAHAREPRRDEKDMAVA